MELDYFTEEHVEDLSYSDLDTFPDFLMERSKQIFSLLLDHNQITVMPRAIGAFEFLVNLDISNNAMRYLSPEICRLQQIKTLTARNNSFDNESLPKELGHIPSLQVLNLSGNQFTEFPVQIAKLRNLKCLYFGANRLGSLPPDIKYLERLEILYLGGNLLLEVPEEVGTLSQLVSLVLCDNKLQSLPHSLVNLRRLQSLSLHNNQLSTLPPEIVSLNLVELSLRNNPLVVRFVEEMIYEPPSLLELAGRAVKTKGIFYGPEDIPRHLCAYLDSAHQCVNPKCEGVYFTSRIEHVKFVDFCGKYRLPLLEYLCSPNCSRSTVCSSSESESDEELPVVNKMKKVLLG